MSLGHFQQTLGMILIYYVGVVHCLISYAGYMHQCHIIAVRVTQKVFQAFDAKFSMEVYMLIFRMK